MSTSAQVAAAWNTAVLQHATFTAICPNAVLFDVMEDSEKGTEGLYSAAEVNFMQCLVSRAQTLEVTQRAEYVFTVDLQYFRSKDEAGANWKAVRDIFETLDALVRSELGSTWSSTVDYWIPSADKPIINEIFFNDEPIWLGSYRYQGLQSVSL